MNTELLEKAGRVLAAYVRGASPNPAEVRFLKAQARRAPATSTRARGTAPATVAATAFDPDALTGANDKQLDAIFRASGTLGIERMINSGVRQVDPVLHEIYNDAYWKGFLPKGLALGETASRIYTGYYKRFWREGDRYLGETRYLDGRVPLKHTLEEVTIERAVNDLEPGRYVLLRYADAVFEQLFYDVMKVVTEDVVLYRGYVGQFPEGRRGLCAPLLRRYKFPQMDAEDHRSLFQSARPAAGEDMPGTWRLDVVANSNHATGIAELRMERGADGVLQSRYKTKAAYKGAPLPDFAAEHFRVADFRTLLGEVRAIDRDVLIGTWITNLRNLSAGSLGLFQTAKNARGQNRLALYYLLNRVA